MKYIDGEIILQRKISYLVYVYIMIIIVIILSLIIFFMLCHYKTYYTINGLVVNEDNHFYIRLYMPLDDIKTIIDNDVVMIDKKEYRYSVFMIDHEYFTDNVMTYQIVKIDVDLDSKYKFNNLTLKLNFIKDDKKIIDYIVAKGG